MTDKLDNLREAKRLDFMIAMYNQLMNDINRHIVVVWQSVTVLVGAFAAWSLIEKEVISLSVAATLIIGISIWVVAHVYDAAYWYNRNLVIIANIERQFLRQSDLKEIHYYFGKHRSTNSMLTHLRLQRALAVGVAVLVFLVHFSSDFWPKPFWALELENYLPIAAMTFGAIVWVRSSERAKQRYKEFLENSPGKEVDVSGIRFGIGHPTDS